MLNRCLLRGIDPQWLTLLIAWGLTFPLSSPSAAAPCLFVGNFDTESVAIVDPRTASVTKYLRAEVGFPAALVATRDSTLLYAGAYDAVAVIDVAQWQIVDTIELDRSSVLAGMIEIAPDGGSLFVTEGFEEGGPSRVDVISTVTHEVLDPIYGFSDATALAISPDGSRLYVADSNAVTVVDVETGLLLAWIEQHATVLQIALSNDGRTLYVSRSGNQYGIAIVDTETMEELSLIQLDHNSYSLALSVDSSLLFADSLSELAIIDTATKGLRAMVDVGGLVTDIAPSRKEPLVFASVYDSGPEADRVVVIDTQDPRIISAIPVAGARSLALVDLDNGCGVACTGDCDADGRVEISELVRGVQMALAAIEVIECPIVDGNADLKVSIEELVRAVRSSLIGCEN